MSPSRKAGRLRAEQTIVLLRVAYVPVGGDKTGHRVEHFWGFSGIGRRLVRKVPRFDAHCAKSVHVFFRQLFDVADVVRAFCCPRRGWLETMEEEDDGPDTVLYCRLD
jgi:hypothetical protein